MSDDQRARLLSAALGFLALEPGCVGAAAAATAGPITWRGVGAIVTGMSRQGYQVSLSDHGAGQWIAVFSAFIGQNALGIGNVYGPARCIIAAFFQSKSVPCRECLQFRARQSSGKL